MPTVELNGRAHDDEMPHDELDPGARPRKRMFAAEYKLAILSQYATAAADGAKGSILRREKLNSSHIVEWHRRRDAGQLAGFEFETGSYEAVRGRG